MLRSTTITNDPLVTPGVLTMPKGQKRTRGIPALHDELKTKATFSLTPKAIEGIDALAVERGLSRSELIEQIGRREIPLCEPLGLGSRTLDESVYSFIEEAVQLLPPLKDVKSSKICILPFNQREALPSSPGAFIVTDWVYTYYNTDLDLKRLFQEDTFVKYMDQHFKGLPNHLVILWLTCDVRLLRLVWSNLMEAYEAIREEILLRSTLKE